MRAIAFYVGYEENIDIIRNYESCHKEQRVRRRERCIEIETCIEREFPFFYLVNRSKERIMFSHGIQDPFSKVKAIYPWRKPVRSLKDIELLLRSDVANVLNPIRYIKSRGGTSITSWKDEEKVERWYRVVSPEFLKRELAIFSVPDFQETVIKHIDRLERYSEGGKIFVKSNYKNGIQSGLIEIKNIFEIMLGLEMISGNADILVSEPLDLLRDKRGTKEYRTFVVLGKIANTSRYLDYDTNYVIPKEVTEFVQNFVEYHRHKLPRNYVVDVGLDRTRGPVLIELNPITASGRYEKNRFDNIIDILQNEPLS